MEPSEPMGCTGQAQAVSEREAVPPPSSPARLKRAAWP